VYDFLLVINSNLGSISHHFWDTATYWLKIANFSYPLSFWWWSGSVGSVVDCINEVNQHQARLVLGWVTIPVCNQPSRSGQLSVAILPWVSTISTSESWDVNRHTTRCTSPISMVLQCKTGVWLRAKETEISAAQWAWRLRKDFLPLSFSILAGGDPFQISGKTLRFLKLESSRQSTVKIWWS